MEFKTIKLKDVLKQYRIEHRIQDNIIYKQVTISKHTGVNFRGEKLGKNIGRKRQFLIDLDSHPKTFMFVRQGVKDGSFGFAPLEVNNCIVTENMPMFDVIDIDEQYLESYLKSSLFRNILDKIQTTGSAQQSIHERQLLELEITIPSKLIDQQNIFKNLKILESRNFELSSEIKNQLSLISKLRQAFLKEAMQGKLVSNETSDGKTGADLLAEIQTEKEKLIKEKKIKKQKPLPSISEEEIPFEIPENWVWCRLGEVCNYGTNPKLEPNKIEKNCWTLDLEDIEKITSKLLNKVRYHERKSTSTKNIFNEGQVLYSKLRPNLDKVIVADENGVCTTEIIPIQFYKKLNPFHFRFYLKSQFFISYVVNSTKGMKMPRVGTDEVRNALLPLPPLEIQNRIVSKLEELMTYCDNLETSIKESQNYNEQLLQQVLREALDVKEVGEEEVLQLVAEEKPMYTISKNVAKVCDVGDMAILAGYIIKKLSTKNPKDFGRVKLQKMLHLAEYHCQLTTELKYQKKVAGPYSSDLEYLIEPKLKSYSFFNIKKEKLGNNDKVNYTALSVSVEIPNLFKQEFKDQSETIDNLLEKFQSKTWEFCEMISTMYAVWNNRLIKKELFTDNLLKQDFLDWDDSKTRFNDQLDHAISWIRKEKIEPVGFGKYIDNK